MADDLESHFHARRRQLDALIGGVIEEAKQQLKGQVTLSLESPSARMYRLATIALFGEPYRTIDELLSQIDAITLEDVAGVGAEFLDPGRQTTVTLGPNQNYN